MSERVSKSRKALTAKIAAGKVAEFVTITVYGAPHKREKKSQAPVEVHRDTLDAELDKLGAVDVTTTGGRDGVTKVFVASAAGAE